MYPLKTSVYFALSKDSFHSYLVSNFLSETNEKSLSEFRKYCEEYLTNDINSIYLNLIEINDRVKEIKYLEHIVTSVNNCWMNLTNILSVLNIDPIDEMIFNASDKLYLNERDIEFYNSIKLMKNKIDFINILCEHLKQFHDFIIEHLEYHYSIKEIEKLNDRIELNKSGKIQIPLNCSRSLFAALIDCNKLLDEKLIPINRTNAGKKLCQHFVFVNEKGLAYEHSVVSKFLSSDYDKNQSQEFREGYNIAVEILVKPKLKKL